MFAEATPPWIKWAAWGFCIFVLPALMALARRLSKGSGDASPHTEQPASQTGSAAEVSAPKRSPPPRPIIRGLLYWGPDAKPSKRVSANQILGAAVLVGLVTAAYLGVRWQRSNSIASARQATVSQLESKLPRMLLSSHQEYGEARFRLRVTGEATTEVAALTADMVLETFQGNAGTVPGWKVVCEVFDVRGDWMLTVRRQLY